jgi:hypothetical protein
MFVIAAIVVIVLLVGGLVGLLRGRRAPMASPDVLLQERREGKD